MNTVTKTEWLDKHLNKLTTPAHRAAALTIAAGELAPFESLLPDKDDFESKALAAGRLIRNGKESFCAAGRLIAELVDADPNAYEKFIKLNPDLDVGFVMLLEQVGRGHKHPDAVMIRDAAVESRVASLPMSEQKKLFEQSVNVAVPDAGEFRCEPKRFKEMSRTEKLRTLPKPYQKPDGVAKVLSFEEQVANEKARLEHQRDLKKYRHVINEKTGKVRFYGSPEYDLAGIEVIFNQLKAISLKNLEGDLKSSQIRAGKK